MRFWKWIVRLSLLLCPVICTSCAVCTVSGCDRSPGTATPTSSAKLRVLATVYPLADVARRVGGEHVDVQWLIETGQTLDGIPRAQLLERTAQTRVTITSGPADDWAQQGLSIDARADRLVEPETTNAARQLYGDAMPDPKAYLWLDPRTVMELAEVMRQRLSGADAGHEQTFAANAAAVRRDLAKVDSEIAAALSNLAGRKLLTVRPVWGAFCRRYGLEQVAPVQSREERLTDADYRALIEAAKTAGAKTVFADISTPPGVRQQIAERTRLKVLTLDPLGSSAPEGHSTYERMMRYNLEQLTKGLE